MTTFTHARAVTFALYYYYSQLRANPSYTSHPLVPFCPDKGGSTVYAYTPYMYIGVHYTQLLLCTPTTNNISEVYMYTVQCTCTCTYIHVHVYYTCTCVLYMYMYITCTLHGYCTEQVPPISPQQLFSALLLSKVTILLLSGLLFMFTLNLPQTFVVGFL